MMQRLCRLVACSLLLQSMPAAADGFAAAQRTAASATERPIQQPFDGSVHAAEQIRQNCRTAAVATALAALRSVASFRDAASFLVHGTAFLMNVAAFRRGAFLLHAALGLIVSFVIAAAAALVRLPRAAGSVQQVTCLVDGWVPAPVSVGLTPCRDGRKHAGNAHSHG